MRKHYLFEAHVESGDEYGGIELTSRPASEGVMLTQGEDMVYVADEAVDALIAQLRAYTVVRADTQKSEPLTTTSS